MEQDTKGTLLLLVCFFPLLCWFSFWLWDDVVAPLLEEWAEGLFEWMSITLVPWLQEKIEQLRDWYSPRSVQGCLDLRNGLHRAQGIEPDGDVDCVSRTRTTLEAHCSYYWRWSAIETFIHRQSSKHNDQGSPGVPPFRYYQPALLATTFPWPVQSTKLRDVNAKDVVEFFRHEVTMTQTLSSVGAFCPFQDPPPRLAMREVVERERERWWNFAVNMEDGDDTSLEEIREKLSIVLGVLDELRGEVEGAFLESEVVEEKGVDGDGSRLSHRSSERILEDKGKKGKKIAFENGVEYCVAS